MSEFKDRFSVTRCRYMGRELGTRLADKRCVRRKEMRKIAWIIVGMALCWPFTLSAQSESYDGASGADRTRLHLLSGRIYLRVNNLDQEKNIEIHTPDASYYILEEGLFRFEVRPNVETELAVI